MKVWRKNEGYFTVNTAYSKAVFGKGAVEAAKYLAGKPAGRYDMSNVIEG